MSYSNVNEQGEYAALVEGTQGEGDLNANTQDYYDIYGNNITGETTNNAAYMDNPTNMRIVANMSNGGGVDEEAPLGTPLTYVIGKEGEYSGSVDYGQVGERKRLYTDLKYTRYFLIYVICLLVILCYYFYYGEYARILYGTNYNGKICGKHLKNYPYLYYPLSPKTSKGEILSKYGKCLESCPTSDHLGEKQSNELVKDGDKKKKSFFEDSFFFFDKNKKREITDKKGNKTTNVVYSDYTKSTNNNLYVEYSLNSPFYDTTNIMNICYPKDKILRQKIINIIFTNRYKTFVNLFSLHNSFFFVFLFVLIAVGLSFIYLLFLHYFPTLTFHIFLISYILSVLFFPIYFIHKHLYLLFNPVKGSLFSYHYLLSILICFVILAHGIISFFMLYIYKNTYKYTSRLVEITLNFIYNMSNMLYAPIVITAISLVWFLLWTCAYIYVMTAGTLYEQRLNLELDSNGNSEIVSLQKVFYYFKSSYFFSILWIYLYFFICEILQSLNQFTISYLGAVWYFCDKNSLNYNLSAGATMRTILSYHFGSLVLSSFINLCTKHFRVFFFWTNSTLSLPFFFSDLIHSLKGRFHFVLKPISRIIDMYTISAYCEMSMTSYPYSLACHTSSKKLINSTSPAASLHGITYVLNIIFPCFTTLVVTFFSFNIFNSFQAYNDLFSPSFIPNPFFVSLTIGVLCGVITSYFITIVSTLADSVLYCFICECYQKQMIDENPLRKIYTPTLLRELILEMYEEYNTRM
ncbi:inner membrane complex suture component, putative [Plasmodium ovale]|uniref:Choline transporter-like protein n=1 Tax=Plasmodium ovale TaxID=36330 RepID=A0A1D3TMC8_PLAOA|nr:inner membrane complex suture component, putative [Plasmodium ovale]